MMKKQDLFKTIIKTCNSVLLSEMDGHPDNCLAEFTVEEWDEYFSHASQHGMLPVVMSCLENLQFSDKQTRLAVVKWYTFAQKEIQRYQLRLKTMAELAEIFAKNGMDIMLFKGAALAQLYPKPEWRVFSDIDFYLYGRCSEGNKAMAQYGIISRPFYHHNTEATLHGILLENHYDFMDRLNHRTNHPIDDEMKRLVEEEGKTIKATFLGNGVSNAYIMTPTMNAIFLLRHMSAHFASETIPLRMIYDWILFLKHHAKEVDWKRVCLLYEKSGLTEFAGIIMELIRSHFQIEYAEVPIKLVANEHTEKVWDSIVEPPKANPYKKYSIPSLVFEAKVFVDNRWKHKIVYPGESYFLLSLRYAWSIMKRKLGLLRITQNG